MFLVETLWVVRLIITVWLWHVWGFWKRIYLLCRKLVLSSKVSCVLVRPICYSSCWRIVLFYSFSFFSPISPSVMANAKWSIVAIVPGIWASMATNVSVQKTMLAAPRVKWMKQASKFQNLNLSVILAVLMKTIPKSPASMKPSNIPMAPNGSSWSCFSIPLPVKRPTIVMMAWRKPTITRNQPLIASILCRVIVRSFACAPTPSYQAYVP